ncbi:MAG TPA: 3-hydroxybutyryl-CoA dehydrogenase [Desulfobacteraceae bacterium]|nr:3-hydroxybutyryl-CoA dehydrogenase [Desulfobacteraceae bacterium]
MTQDANTQVAVIGAGFMGTGIAQVCIRAGMPCVLIDTDDTCLDRARKDTEAWLGKGHNSGKQKPCLPQMLSLLETRNSLDIPADASWVIESVFEDETLKKTLLAAVEKQVGPDTAIATNTSSIPVGALAAALERPDRFVGLHFFGPVPRMGLVEVVKGGDTSEKTFAAAMAFSKALGKTPVGVRKDIPGFVMNRIFAAAFKECQDLAAEGVASVEDIDAGMRLGYGWRIGPFQIADNAGLDTVARINRSMKAMDQSCLYSRADLVEKLVEKGCLGRKSGRGFYTY